MQFRAVPGVLVPQEFHCLGPAFDLLDLVQDEDGAVAFPGESPGLVPLLGDPDGGLQHRGVGGGVMVGLFEVVQDLEHHGGLSYLAWSGYDLHEPSGLTGAFEQDV